METIEKEKTATQVFLLPEQQKELSNFDYTEAAIKQMSDKYLPLVIKDINDKEGFAQVHSARMIVKNHRVNIEKRRKELKEDSLRRGRNIDTVASYIKSKLDPIENHLDTQEDAYEAEKEKIRMETFRIEQERIAAERKKELDRLAEIQRIENERVLAEQKAENERIAEAARIENERIAEENRAKKEKLDALEAEIKADREKAEAIRIETEHERAEYEAKVKAEQEEINKSREKERKEWEERIEREQEEIKAEREAIAKQKAAEVQVVVDEFHNAIKEDDVDLAKQALDLRKGITPAQSDAEKLTHLVSMSVDFGDPELLTPEGDLIWETFKREANAIAVRVNGLIHAELLETA